MKTSEISQEAFETAVSNANKELVKSVKNATSVIKMVYDESKKYSVQTATAFAIKRLKKAKSDETATDVKGIIFGKRTPGETGKGPTTYGFLSGKKGMEVKAWHGMVDTGDKKVKVPEGYQAAIKIEMENNDFTGADEWWIKNIIGRGKDVMKSDEILKKLHEWGAIVELADVRKLIKKTNPMPVIAIKVVITGANASNKFGTDNKVPIWNVVETDGKITHEAPNISLRTKKVDETMAWIRVVGTAPEFIEVEDFVEICKDVTTRFDDPLDQASFLGNALDERPMIIIGSVSKIQGDNENGYSININALALLEDNIDANEVIQGQQQLPATQEVEEKTNITKETEKPIEEAPTLEEETSTSEEIKVEEIKVEEIKVEEIKKPKTKTEKTKEMQQIEAKLLMLASMKCGLPGNSMRSQQINALKKTSFEDMRKFGAIAKYGEDIVQTVYDELINSEV